MHTHLKSGVDGANAGVSLILGNFLKNLKSGCKFFFLRGDFFPITRGRKKQCFVAFPSFIPVHFSRLPILVNKGHVQV